MFVKAQTAPPGFVPNYTNTAFRSFSAYGIFGMPQDTFTVPTALRGLTWNANKGDSSYLWSVIQQKWILQGATAPAASTLTIDSPLTGISYDGSSPVTIGLDTTIIHTSAYNNGTYLTSVDPVLANFYLKDSALSSDRTVDLNGHSLVIQGSGSSVPQFFISTGDDEVNLNATTGQKIIRISGNTDDALIQYNNSTKIQLGLGSNQIVHTADTHTFNIVDNLEIKKAGNLFLKIDPVNGRYRIGDDDGAGNGTKIRIDDPTQAVLITGGVLVSTLNTAGSSLSTTGTRQQVISDGNGLITFTDKTYSALTFGATTTWDINTGPNKTLTLTGDANLVFSNIQNGEGGTLIVVQDGTGGWTLTVPDQVITIDADPGDTTVLAFTYDGNAYYWASSIGASATIGFNGLQNASADSIELGGTLESDRTIDADTSGITISSAAINGGKPLLNIYKSGGGAGVWGVAEFKSARIAEVYISTEDSTNGFGSLLFYSGIGKGGDNLKMTTGYDAPADHVFMADVRNTTYASWEVNGTAVGGFYTGTKNFWFGTGVTDRGTNKRVQVKGSTFIHDSLFVGKVPLGAITDSIVVYRPSDSTFRKIDAGRITGSGAITIGTTTITSGTTGRVLYDNSGLVGEMTTSGTGTQLALTSSPTLTTPVISSITNTGTFTIPTVTGTAVQFAEQTAASAASPTPTGDARINWYQFTALAVTATFQIPSGTPANHNELYIRIFDNTVARTLAWNGIYRAATDLPLPLITIVGKDQYLHFIYNSRSTTWDLTGYSVNGIAMMLVIAIILGGMITYVEKRYKKGVLVGVLVIISTQLQSQTRLWMGITNATSPVSPAVKSDWNVTSPNIFVRLWPTKFSGVNTSNVNATSGASGVASPRKMLIGSWISPPLVAQTIASGSTITGQMKLSRNGTFTVVGIIYIRLCDEDGTNITEIGNMSSTTLVTSTNTNRTFSFTLPGNVTVADNQRIFIELGGNYTSGVNTALTVTINTTIGATSTDAPADNTSTAIVGAWIEFSQTLVFRKKGIFL